MAYHNQQQLSYLISRRYRSFKIAIETLTATLLTKANGLTSKTDDLEIRSRMDKMVVLDVQEKIGGDRETSVDCEESVRGILTDKLHMPDAVND